MKGIILAAGKGTRLYPMTKPVCKPLLPVYDKPLIYYPLSTLIQAGCDDILIIVPPGEEKAFSELLDDGGKLGVSIQYRVQPAARGIADAMLIGADFIGNDSVCLALGDNIFYSADWQTKLRCAAENKSGAVVFGIWVENPRPFGVVAFDENGRATSIEEKPRVPKSNYIVPGLYFYDSEVVSIAKNLRPSARGELEITDVNLEYLRRGQLSVVPLERGFTWMDAGTADSLYKAAGIIRSIQSEAGELVGCIEEDAYSNGWISREQLHAMGEELKMTDYGKYILGL
ncbi:MAG: glucose-1-phosphate thymidylyltransferase RfbA [Clostridiales bacterium]|nr:glucose-1-phosphate thymidylyltransferase RfbA [Clostridiales bacterium]